MRSVLTKLLLAGFSSLPLMACSAVDAIRPPEILFAGTPQELVPHSDGDEHVLGLSVIGPMHEVYVERIASTRTPGEFVASLYRGDEVIAEFHMIDDGKSLRYAREVLFEQNVAFSYEEPIPYVFAPLDAGVHTMRTTVEVYRPSDGHRLGRGTIEFRFQAKRAGAGAFGEEFEVSQQRRVQLGQRVIESRTVMYMAPGVGEVRTRGEPVESRLLCARIAGRRIGDCVQAATR